MKRIVLANVLFGLFLFVFAEEHKVVENALEDDDHSIHAIAELEELCFSGDTSHYTLEFEDLLVTYMGARHTYITDGTRAMLLFGYSGLQTGQRIKGKIYGRAGLYYGTPEFYIETEDVNVEILSAGNTVPRRPVSAEALYDNPKEYVNQYIELNDVRFNAYFTQNDYFRYLLFYSGGKWFDLFNLFNRIWYISPDRIYSMQGVVSIYEDDLIKEVQVSPLATADLQLTGYDYNYYLAPVFSLSPGKYEGTKTVAIEVPGDAETRSTSGTTIYYRIDGGEWTAYHAPLVIDKDTELSAYSVSGVYSSFVVSASYFITTPSDTGIAKTLTHTSEADTRTWNLQGVQINHPTRGGVYIQNGKKLIVR